MADVETLLKALANKKRLQILRWLANPVAHFPPQRDGDLREDGVCGVFLVKKLGVAQPTASEHLRVLVDAGLIRPKKIKQWTFYRRCEDRIAALPQLLGEVLTPASSEPVGAAIDFALSGREPS